MSESVGLHTEITAMLNRHDFPTLDAKLATVADSVEGTSALILITWLRGSFSGRAWLPNWQRLREAARAEFIRVGKDPERLLMGLYQEVDAEREWGTHQFVQRVLGRAIAFPAKENQQ